MAACRSFASLASLNGGSAAMSDEGRLRERVPIVGVASGPVAGRSEGDAALNPLASCGDEHAGDGEGEEGGRRDDGIGTAEDE